MMVKRTTLISILRKLASSPNGISRWKLYAFSRRLTSKELDRIRDDHWLDRGLKSLISEEILPRRRFHNIRWFLTPSGRDFLRRISVNPYALPDVAVGRQPYQSLEAKRYADKKNRKAQRRRRNQRKYYQRLQNPLYDAATYDTPIDASRFPAIGAKGWNNLPVVTKIRLLRQRCRQRALRQRFIQIAKEAS